MKHLIYVDLDSTFFNSEEMLLNPYEYWIAHLGIEHADTKIITYSSSLRLDHNRMVATSSGNVNYRHKFCMTGHNSCGNVYEIHNDLTMSFLAVLHLRNTDHCLFHIVSSNRVIAQFISNIRQFNINAILYTISSKHNAHTIAEYEYRDLHKVQEYTRNDCFFTRYFHSSIDVVWNRIREQLITIHCKRGYYCVYNKFFNVYSSNQLCAIALSHVMSAVNNSKRLFFINTLIFEFVKSKYIIGTRVISEGHGDMCNIELIAVDDASNMDLSKNFMFIMQIGLNNYILDID